MGLFDGAAGGGGSTADLAALTGWPVVLVVNARAQAGSIAALVEGFVGHRRDITISAVICNRVGSANHRAMLDDALSGMTPPLATREYLPFDAALALPARHLGLVQASEHGALDEFLDTAAQFVTAHLNLDQLRQCARPGVLGGDQTPHLVPPFGQRIAVARDDAFAFCYPALLEGWRAQGAEVYFFSPLADEAPDPATDAIYLPGGYPELHAGRLANSIAFKRAMTRAAAANTAIYGECGGYMVLGRGLVDSDGVRHAMTGLLALETSFAVRRRHLGYRCLRTATASFLGDAGVRFRGHEFHYASVIDEGPGKRLFDCTDSRGDALAPAGLVAQNTAGSFIHLIDCAP
jgi:cobyrinic acid a,c-diamide synthase